MKYEDGKYHVEWMVHEYFNGYKEGDWTIVNVYGEPCISKRSVTLRFGNKDDAERYCNKLNINPEGAVLRNLE